MTSNAKKRRSVLKTLEAFGFKVAGGDKRLTLLTYCKEQPAKGKFILGLWADGVLQVRNDPDNMDAGAGDAVQLEGVPARIADHFSKAGVSMAKRTMRVALGVCACDEFCHGSCHGHGGCDGKGGCVCAHEKAKAG